MLHHEHTCLTILEKTKFLTKDNLAHALLISLCNFDKHNLNQEIVYELQKIS